MALICFVRMLAGPRWQFGWSLLVMACHCVALAAAGSAGPLIGMTTTIAVTFGLLLVVLGRRGAASIYWLGLAALALAAYVVPAMSCMAWSAAATMTDAFSLVGVATFLLAASWLGYGFPGSSTNCRTRP